MWVLTGCPSKSPDIKGAVRQMAAWRQQPLAMRAPHPDERQVEWLAGYDLLVDPAGLEPALQLAGLAAVPVALHQRARHAAQQPAQPIRDILRLAAAAGGICCCRRRCYRCCLVKLLFLPPCMPASPRALPPAATTANPEPLWQPPPPPRRSRKRPRCLRCHLGQWLLNSPGGRTRRSRSCPAAP